MVADEFGQSCEMPFEFRETFRRVSIHGSFKDGTADIVSKILPPVKI